MTDPIGVLGQLSPVVVPRLTVQHLLPAVPALLLAGTTDISVTWPQPFDDAAYTLAVTLPPPLLGKLTTTSTQDRYGCTVHVVATGAVALGSWLDVLAIRYV